MTNSNQKSGTELPLGGPEVDKNYWVAIPGGPFQMGSDRTNDPQAQPYEMPQQFVEIGIFYIARYPVTNAQFEAFATAPDGYNTRRWWTEAGWQWKGKRTEPDEYGDLAFREPNQPRIYVTWYEAVAFCNWLGNRLGCEVRLPTETEWEKAARGEDGRIYPWGDEWDSTKLNSSKSNTGKTSAVGTFAGDVSPYGVLDMAGNIREWCLTKVLSMGPYDYAFWQYADGITSMDNTVEGDTPHMLRGGSWLSVSSGCRCASRSGSSPYGRSENWGFRVAIGPEFKQVDSTTSSQIAINPTLERLGILLLFIFAFLLRFYGVERESLWLDEIGQVVVAQNSWWQTILQSGHHAGSTPLDYLVTHFTLLLGQSEGILRLPPVLWGALAVILTYQLGKSTFDRSVGAAAALLLTFTPIHVYYSREVRFYSLAVLLALVVMWSFQWALKKPMSKKKWLLYTMALCLGLYSHYYMGIIIGIQGVWLFVKVWREQNTPYQAFVFFLAAASGAILVFIPWVIYDNILLENPIGQHFHFPTLNYLFSAPFSHNQLFPSRRQGAWLLAASVGGAASLFFIIKNQLKSKQSQYILLFLSTSLVGIIVALSLDYLTGYFFAHRQLLIYTPYLLLVIAYGGLQTFRAVQNFLSVKLSIKLPDGLAIVIMVGFMLFTLGTSLRTVYTVEQRENWRAASRYLLQYAQEDDIIITSCTMCVNYYSPELTAQVIAPNTRIYNENYRRIWFFEPTDLSTDMQATIDLSTLENQSPTYHFTLYLIDLNK